jgi:hypothetical protein
MRQILLIIVFLSGVNLILAQQNSDKIELLVSNRVDTSSTDIKSILELYENYYKFNPDAIYDNPYWNKQKKNCIGTLTFQESVFFKEGSTTSR